MLLRTASSEKKIENEIYVLVFEEHALSCVWRQSKMIFENHEVTGVNFEYFVYRYYTYAVT